MGCPPAPIGQIAVRHRHIYLSSGGYRDLFPGKRERGRYGWGGKEGANWGGVLILRRHALFVPKMHVWLSADRQAVAPPRPTAEAKRIEKMAIVATGWHIPPPPPPSDC